MPPRPLLSPASLENLLRRRAAGELPKELVLEFGLTRQQVKGLLAKYSARLHVLCAEMGVEPPTRGGLRKAPIPSPPGGKVRRCLGGCGKNFNSWGPENQICPVCTKSKARRSGGDYTYNTGGRVRAPGAA